MVSRLLVESHFQSSLRRHHLHRRLRPDVPNRFAPGRIRRLFRTQLCIVQYVLQQSLFLHTASHDAAHRLLHHLFHLWLRPVQLWYDFQRSLAGSFRVYRLLDMCIVGDLLDTSTFDNSRRTSANARTRRGYAD